MGTNYYVKENYCKSCKRYETMHIGKQSFGWAFLFHSYPGLETEKEWREMLAATRGTQIVDEYGRDVDWCEFLVMIEKNRDLKSCSDATEYLDPEGYRFSTREFS